MWKSIFTAVYIFREEWILETRNSCCYKPQIASVPLCLTDYSSKWPVSHPWFCFVFRCSFMLFDWFSNEPFIICLCACIYIYMFELDFHYSNYDFGFVKWNCLYFFSFHFLPVITSMYCLLIATGFQIHFTWNGLYQDWHAHILVQ